MNINIYIQKHNHSMVILACILFTLFSISPSVNASRPISFSFTGQVTVVDDRSNLLGGSITNGDSVSGMFTYDLDTPDTKSSPTVGDYWHYSAPYGITVQINGFTFKTDENNPEFLVEVVNNHGTPACDNFLLRSYKNINATHISWQLDDSSLSALSSTDLPTSFNLGSWKQDCGLTISGGGLAGDYFIRTILNSVIYIPPNTAPNTPITPSPFKRATDQTINPTLSWNGGDPDGDTVTYTVYLDTNSNPTTSKCSDITSTSCSVTDLSYSTTYYWKVIASDGKATPVTGAIWSFTTITPTSTSTPTSMPTTTTTSPGGEGAIETNENKDYSYTIVMVALIGALATIIAAYFGYLATKKK